MLLFVFSIIFMDENEFDNNLSPVLHGIDFIDANMINKKLFSLKIPIDSMNKMNKMNYS